MKNKSRLMGIMWCALGAILFSLKAILVKLAYQYEVDSVSLLTLRMLFTFPFFVAIGWWASRQMNNAPILRNDWFKIVGVGVLGFYMASLLDFFGLQYITAGMERLILYMYPTLVILISAFFYGKKIKPIQLLALLLTYAGITIAFFDKSLSTSDENFWLGATLVAGAALAYAIYVVQSGELLPRIGTFRFTSIAICSAAAAILLHNLLWYGLAIFHFAPEVYYLALLIAILSTVLPSLMMSEGIRIIGANNAAIIGSIGPISTIILAYILLGEVFGNIQILGTSLVIGGVVLLSLKKV